jgi:hypothetical protein
VETFIGLAEFRPTNTFILDVAAKQIKVTLEKTNYFAVCPGLYWRDSSSPPSRMINE